MILTEKKNYILMHELSILEKIMQIIKNYFFFPRNGCYEKLIGRKNAWKLEI